MKQPAAPHGPARCRGPNGNRQADSCGAAVYATFERTFRDDDETSAGGI